MDKSKIIDYYKTHSNKDTRRQFNLTYNQLRNICEEANFRKSSEQIKATYKNTKIAKYGSLDKAYKEMVENKDNTILSRYGSYDLYYEIRSNNSRKTNNKIYGTDYPMQNKEVIRKANKTKEENRR